MNARRNSAPVLVITCEHAGHRIPARYRKCFAGQRKTLESHHGYDRGALTMARNLARRFGAPLFHSTVSRLLVDLNRSPGHRGLHSEAVGRLPAETRRAICQDFYAPFRNEAEGRIALAVAQGRCVVHLSSHSFAPVLNGAVRNADVGLLYDPGRPREVALCHAWQEMLAAREPDLRVRRNYPYRGTSDGFTAFLRRRFPSDDYVGIELEINQRIVLKGGRRWARLRAALLDSLSAALLCGI